MGNWLDRAKRALASGSFLAQAGTSNQSNPWRRKFAFEELEPRLTLAAAGLIATPQTYSGALNGKVVFTSAGHGWQWNTTLGRYATDRGDNNEIVEDFGNQDQMTLYADDALRAGATVVPMRPVGRQLNEVVLDNDSAGVTFSAGWSNSSSTRFYDEDYGASTDAVPYRYATANASSETATATYTPNIPQAGFYPVYTWVLYGTDRTAQTYTINHTGGSTQVTVDHSIVGSGWVYLGTYHFNAGSSATGEGSVQISNKGPNSTGTKVVIADAIRFGNGMGDYIYTDSGATAISGYPREDENSYHWIARSIGQGATPASILGADNNVSAPSDFAQNMYHGAFGGAVYVGFHSNAGGGRGARGLIDSSAPTPNQNTLATILGNQINQDMQSLNGAFEYNWTTGTTATYTSAFGEINLGASAEMDATIIEVAFHDDVMDAAIMRDPKGRDQIARSVYQGTVQYFVTYGVTNTSLPTPPTNVRVVSNANGAVTLNWAAGPTSPAAVYGNAATGYKVYASVDGYGFDGGRVVSGVGTTTLTITGLDPNTAYYFKVTATNAGGESGASEVVTALPSGGTKQVLIVNGFDRFDRTQNFRYAYLGQQVDRVWPRYNNSHDYVVQMETAIQASKPGVHVATTSNEAVISGAVNLTDYNTVIWITGNESTADHTFDATEQAKITTFINAGGNLFLSGSEIGWDLDQQNNGRTFYESTLLANYVADDAGTYTATANAGGIFAGMSSFVFSNGSAFSQVDGQLYDVAFPDVIAPQAGALSALTYSGGLGGTAAIQVHGTGGKGNIVMFAFPFETMTVAARRQTAMGNILSFLGAEISVKTFVNGQDADSATGPILVPGTSASLAYLVTNPGIVSLSSVSVVDDNGTPGNAADDFNATYSSGDTNSNGQLDVGETWTYTATRTVAAGQTTRSGKAIGMASSTTVSASDVANYFGVVSGIDVRSLVWGQDADTGPGPTISASGSALFTYTVMNTGNNSLSNVTITDDNGTPGNAADDYLPTYMGGDTNGNGLLDTTEGWIYSATRPAQAGPFTGITTVTALDNSLQSVNATKTTYYFGSAPSVDLQMSVNGDDADSPPGPTLTPGSSATFGYVVTNTGNVSVNVILTDDNGTPGDTGDDFNPTFTGGDTNNDSHLDLGEIWTYTIVRTAIAGQHTNTSNADARDSLNQAFVSYESASYFVPANADFNSDTIVDSGDYVTWRKNSGITSGAVLSQGDANGDGMVDGIDYDVWRSQFNTPIDGDGGMGTAAASGVATATAGGVETAAPGKSNQTLSLSATSAATPAPTPNNDSDDANDVAFSALMSGGQRGVSLRRSVERARSLAIALPRDWTELLNDLAERRARHDATDLSATAGDLRSANDYVATDGATRMDSSVTKALATI